MTTINLPLIDPAAPVIANFTVLPGAQPAPLSIINNPAANP